MTEKPKLPKVVRSTRPTIFLLSSTVAILVLMVVGVLGKSSAMHSAIVITLSGLLVGFSNALLSEYDFKYWVLPTNLAFASAISSLILLAWFAWAAILIGYVVLTASWSENAYWFGFMISAYGLTLYLVVSAFLVYGRLNDCIKEVNHELTAAWANGATALPANFRRVVWAFDKIFLVRYEYDDAQQAYVVGYVSK